MLWIRIRMSFIGQVCLHTQLICYLLLMWAWLKTAFIICRDALKTELGLIPLTNWHDQDPFPLVPQKGPLGPSKHSLHRINQTDFLSALLVNTPNPQLFPGYVKFKPSAWEVVFFVLASLHLMWKYQRSFCVRLQCDFTLFNGIWHT